MITTGWLSDGRMTDTIHPTGYTAWSRSLKVNQGVMGKCLTGVATTI